MTVIVNPATGTPVADIPDATPAGVASAVDAAAAAFPGWSQATAGERARALLAFADLIDAHADELTLLEVEDTGKPRGVVRDGEIPFATDNLRFFAGSARSLEGTGAGVLSAGYTSMLIRRPLGVVAGIAPWNFPLVMAAWKLGPALAAGNTMVLKPAPATPRSALRLAELAREAGIPDGVLGVVTGGAEVGAALVRDPRVRMASVTGSTATGKAVMAAAAQDAKRVHLELGGKAPVLVFADADISAMARAVTLGATYNTGQDCTAATRVYAERAVLDEVVEALRDAVQSVRVGDPWDDGTDIGPLISHAHRDRVRGFIDRARAAGAGVVTGGTVPDDPGAYLTPALVTGAEQASELIQDEVFGPVLAVVPHDGEDDAVRLANDSRYGLASSVWTTDVARALRVTHRIEAGVTWINDHLPIASEAPHGGVKGSGFGKDMSHEAILEYTVTHHVMARHAAPPEHDSFRPA